MEWLLGISVIVFIVMAIVGLSDTSGQNLRQAKINYDESLINLKNDPSNATIKQRTLGLGRIYCNLTRDNKGVAIYDEMALMNDINAACAASHQSRPTNIEKIPVLDIEARLLKLQSLKNLGLIDDADFVRKRKEIVDQL